MDLVDLPDGWRFLLFVFELFINNLLMVYKQFVDYLFFCMVYKHTLKNRCVSITHPFCRQIHTPLAVFYYTT